MSSWPCRKFQRKYMGYWLMEVKSAFKYELLTFMCVTVFVRSLLCEVQDFLSKEILISHNRVCNSMRTWGWLQWVTVSPSAQHITHMLIVLFVMLCAGTVTPCYRFMSVQKQHDIESTVAVMLMTFEPTPLLEWKVGIYLC